MKVLCLFAALSVVASLAKGECPGGPNAVKRLEWFTGEKLPCMHAGGVRVGENATLFYWLHRKRNPDSERLDPLVVWLQGGPGSSSNLGNFAMHGPLQIIRTGSGSSDFAVTERNESWVDVANVIYLDQPVGTGFSYGTPVTNLQQSSEHFVRFMASFLDMYPEFRLNPFFITGESYGGKYIPSYTWAVMQYNAVQQDESKRINLQGMMVGDPFSSPLRQRTSMHVLPRALNILDESDMDQIDSLERICEESLFKTQYKESEDKCSDIIEFISAVTGDVLAYDTRSFKSDWDPTEQAIEAYFAKSSRVKQLLEDINMSDSPKHPPFEMSSEVVGEALSLDNLVDYTHVYEAVLREASFPVLVYAGEFDAKDGPFGQELWMRKLDFEGKEDFWAMDRKLYFLPDGTVGGYFRASSKTRFQTLTVPKAGHFVPANNIRVTLSILVDFWKNNGLVCHQSKEPFCSTKAIRCDAMNECSGHGSCDDRGKCICEHGWAGGACDMQVINLSQSQSFESVGPKWYLLALPPSFHVKIASELPFDLYLNRGDAVVPTRFQSDIHFGNQVKPLTVDAAALGLEEERANLGLVYIQGISHRDNKLLKNKLTLVVTPVADDASVVSLF